MHLLGQRPLGVVILILLGALVYVKRRATGSIIEFDRSTQLSIWLTNLFNMFFLLVVNPAAAILLLFERLNRLSPMNVAISRSSILAGLEIAGLILYLLGFVLMTWALLSLGGSYQLGGSAPRESDLLVRAGPYRFVRHPMYSAALSIALGLALLIQSSAVFIAFCIYAALILGLIPTEERELQGAYREGYDSYQKNTKRLIPYVY